MQCNSGYCSVTLQYHNIRKGIKQSSEQRAQVKAKNLKKVRIYENSQSNFIKIYVDCHHYCKNTSTFDIIEI